jgi:hydrogenase/urease accessory protein HupE
MPDFWLYFSIGLNHVLDIHAYDHVLFLTALTVPYTFKDWKKVLLLVTLFTIGHTTALLLSVYGVLTINSTIVEFLIPITILATALYNLFTASKKKVKTDNINFVAFTTLFFGIIHGLGFSNYFKIVIFALGIEAAQITVVVTVLLLSYLVINVLKQSKREWLLVTSAFVAGVVVPMIIDSEIW